MLYQCAILILAIFSLACCLHLTVATRTADFQGSTCLEHGCAHLGLLSDAALVLGSIVALLSFDLWGFGKDLDDCLKMLRRYATKKDFFEVVLRNSRWDFFASSILWLASVEERVRGSGAMSTSLTWKLDAWETFYMFAFAFSTFVLLVMTNLVVYVCRILMEMVDTYCCEVADNHNLTDAVANWNMLQAMLRKASGDIEHCFFTIQTTILATVLLGVTDVQQSMEMGEGHLLLLIPGALITLGLLRIFCASAVTAKCEHVPSLINSLGFSSQFDHNRQYVVEYITNSAAGFYVYDVRLTSALALKIGYVFAALAFSLANKMLIQA